MTRSLLLFANLILTFLVQAQIKNADSPLSQPSAFKIVQTSLPNDSLSRFKNVRDSLGTVASKSNDQLNSDKRKLDSLQRCLHTRLDSLAKLRKTDTLTIKMMARIKAQSDSLESKKASLEKIIK